MTLNRNSKYGNKRTKVDGRNFASKVEAQRYLELKAREKKGLITGLVCQPRFKLMHNDKLVCTYIADFMYSETLKPTRGIFQVIEDVKGGATTPDFNIKAKFMEADGRHVHIVRKRSRNKTNRWFVDDVMEEKMVLPRIENDI